MIFWLLSLIILQDHGNRHVQSSPPSGQSLSAITPSAGYSLYRSHRNGQSLGIGLHLSMPTTNINSHPGNSSTGQIGHRHLPNTLAQPVQSPFTTLDYYALSACVQPISTAMTPTREASSLNTEWQPTQQFKSLRCIASLTSSPVEMSAYRFR